MRVKQFEVWIADLNPTIGTGPGKVRPVVVVQNDLLNKHHPSSIICPITTKVTRESGILRIHLQKGAGGLEENWKKIAISCWIRLGQLTIKD
jgi:mRNA interferase MazF